MEISGRFVSQKDSRSRHDCARFRQVVAGLPTVEWEKVFLADHLKTIERVADNDCRSFLLRRDKTKAIRDFQTLSGRRAGDNLKHETDVTVSQVRAFLSVQLVNGHFIEKYSPVHD